MTDCRKQQINEETYNKLLKEFNNKVPCVFKNEICTCSYIIKNKKITRSQIFKSAIIQLIANLKEKILGSSKYSQSQINELNNQLKVARDLLNYVVETDFIKLAENLYENYKNANLNRLERENKKLKAADSYLWDQLTKEEKATWILSATMISFNYLILTKNQTREEIK